MFAYSPLGKPLEKTKKNQVGAVKTLDPSNKEDELKHIKGIFPQNLMNDLIRVKVREIVKLQDFIITDVLYYRSKRRNVYNFSEYL